MGSTVQLNFSPELVRGFLKRGAFLGEDCRLLRKGIHCRHVVQRCMVTTAALLCSCHFLDCRYKITICLLVTDLRGIPLEGSFLKLPPPHGPWALKLGFPSPSPPTVVFFGGVGLLWCIEIRLGRPWRFPKFFCFPVKGYLQQGLIYFWGLQGTFGFWKHPHGAHAKSRALLR